MQQKRRRIPQQLKTSSREHRDRPERASFRKGDPHRRELQKHGGKTIFWHTGESLLHFITFIRNIFVSSLPCPGFQLYFYIRYFLSFKKCKKLLSGFLSNMTWHFFIVWIKVTSQAGQSIIWIRSQFLKINLFYDLIFIFLPKCRENKSLFQMAYYQTLNRIFTMVFLLAALK